MKSKYINIIILSSLIILVLAGCPQAGPENGTNPGTGSSGGGSRTITWEASGNYANSQDLEFSIQYSAISPNGQTIAPGPVFEPSLPWSDTRDLETGTGVSINLAVLENHYSNVTLKIYENGIEVASHSIDRTVDPSSDLGGIPNPSLTHVVGN